MVSSPHALRHKITHVLKQGEEWLFANPKIVLSLIFTVTILFALCLPYGQTVTRNSVQAD
ncbi:hypothetical protein [Aromatoleum bremense]|uniref:Uncharacterized protein n=1 Tax=Aromatoleum bremense TaxID=76115 RepID=A0ABX1NYQ6_9RHOO|nr:hypothetical protein [Aromatoleum bremense]NMG17185.1 hypothetical protein [Aromatoleum bremense]QTQ29997.1 Uncharacterized protein pbN1_00060 [Aromatoleum bremense]